MARPRPAIYCFHHNRSYRHRWAFCMMPRSQNIRRFQASTYARSPATVDLLDSCIPLEFCSSEPGLSYIYVVQPSPHIHRAAGRAREVCQCCAIVDYSLFLDSMVNR